MFWACVCVCVRGGSLTCVPFSNTHMCNMFSELKVNCEAAGPPGCRCVYFFFCFCPRVQKAQARSTWLILPFCQLSPSLPCCLFSGWSLSSSSLPVPAEESCSLVRSEVTTQTDLLTSYEASQLTGELFHQAASAHTPLLYAADIRWPFNFPWTDEIVDAFNSAGADVKKKIDPTQVNKAEIWRNVLRSQAHHHSTNETDTSGVGDALQVLRKRVWSSEGVVIRTSRHL